MKALLEKLLKFPAYLEFPSLTPEQLKYRKVDSVIYGKADPMFSGTREERSCTAYVSCGPHYKCRRFWLWSKRKGWKWGNRFRGEAVESMAEEGDGWNAMARVTQRWSIDSSTRPFARWNGVNFSVDLDAWDSFVSKPFPAAAFELSFGVEEEPAPDLFKDRQRADDKLFE